MKNEKQILRNEAVKLLMLLKGSTLWQERLKECVGGDAESDYKHLIYHLTDLAEWKA
jgi:hypothetical protein